MATLVVDRIAYEAQGEGEPVLLIHGLGATSNFWTPLLPALARMRALRPDLPGSGRSAEAAGAETIAGLVQAMRRVLDHAGAERAHVVGHSLGTIVAAHLVAAAPERAASLLLFGPLAAPPDPARAGLRARAAAAEAGPAAMQEIADQVVGAGTSRETKEQAPAAVAAAREMVMRQPPAGYARLCRALAEAEPAAFDRIACPTLLVTGDQDAIAPPQSVRALADRIGGARVEVLARCGHWTVLERPEASVEFARRHLGGRR